MIRPAPTLKVSRTWGRWETSPCNFPMMFPRYSHYIPKKKFPHEFPIQKVMFISSYSSIFFIFILYIHTGWWFQTFFIFHNIWDNPSHWLIFVKMVKTTNQHTFLKDKTQLTKSWTSWLLQAELWQFLFCGDVDGLDQSGLRDGWAKLRGISTFFFWHGLPSGNLT